MHLFLQLIISISLLIINVESKFSGGRAGGGGRGFSSARSSVGSRGSFHYGGGRTTSFHGSTYHIPPTATMSRDNFASSLHSSNLVVTNNHVAVHSTSQPIFVNGNYYYFGYNNYQFYHHQPVYVKCSARIQDFTHNTVPLNTTIYNGTIGSNNQTQEALDKFKYDVNSTQPEPNSIMTLHNESYNPQIMQIDQGIQNLSINDDIGAGQKAVSSESNGASLPTSSLATPSSYGDMNPSASAAIVAVQEQPDEDPPEDEEQQGDPQEFEQPEDEQSDDDDPEVIIQQLPHYTDVLEYATSPMLTFNHVYRNSIIRYMDLLHSGDLNEQETTAVVAAYNHAIDVRRELWEQIMLNEGELDFWRFLSDCRNAINGFLVQPMVGRGWQVVNNRVQRVRLPFYDPASILRVVFYFKFWREINTLTGLLEHPLARRLLSNHPIEVQQEAEDPDAEDPEAEI